MVSMDMIKDTATACTDRTTYFHRFVSHVKKAASFHKSHDRLQGTVQEQKFCTCEGEERLDDELMIARFSNRPLVFIEN